MTGVIHDVPQRSPAWHALRVGRLTGSRAPALGVTLKSGGEAAARADLRAALVCEQLVGASVEDRYVSRDMQRGIDREPDAIRAYEAATGALVDPIGFVAHPTLRAGCSPDGYIADEGGIVEIKCPKMATHLKTLGARAIPREYVYQLVHNLWITGAPWCDFVSFDDRFPPSLSLVILRYYAFPRDVGAYELQARLLLDEVDRQVAALAGVRDAYATIPGDAYGEPAHVAAVEPPPPGATP